MDILFALLLIPAFAIADGFTGGGFGWNRLAHANGGPLRGRGLYYAAPLLMALGWLAGSWSGLALAITWAFYRSIRNPPGTITGENRPATVLRHAWLLLPVIGWALIFQRNLPLAIVYAGLYAMAAVSVAFQYGQVIYRTAWTSEPDYNKFETVRGMAFGLTAAMLVLTT